MSLKNNSNSSQRALRYNQGKAPMHLVPTSMIRAMAEVMEAGAQKYEERNWEKGMNYSIVYGCLMRHLMAFWDGEDVDETDGVLHIKKVMSNAAMLVEFVDRYPELDDRPHKFFEFHNRNEINVDEFENELHRDLYFLMVGAMC